MLGFVKRRHHQQQQQPLEDGSCPSSFGPEVHESYSLVSHVGSGAFSVVWSAIDKRQRFGGGKVAIKKVCNVFRGDSFALITVLCNF